MTGPLQGCVSWAYASIRDLVAVLKAVTVGSTAFAVVLLLTGFHGHSRAILVIDWLLVVLLVGGIRLSIRLLRGGFRFRPAGSRAVLILGAAGAGVVRDPLESPGVGCYPEGFLDDDPGPWRPHHASRSGCRTSRPDPFGSSGIRRRARSNTTTLPSSRWGPMFGRLRWSASTSRASRAPTTASSRSPTRTSASRSPPAPPGSEPWVGGHQACYSSSHGS